MRGGPNRRSRGGSVESREVFVEEVSSVGCDHPFFAFPVSSGLKDPGRTLSRETSGGTPAPEPLARNPRFYSRPGRCRPEGKPSCIRGGGSPLLVERNHSCQCRRRDTEVGPAGRKGHLGSGEGPRVSRARGTTRRTNRPQESGSKGNLSGPFTKFVSLRPRGEGGLVNLGLEFSPRGRNRRKFSGVH